ncbi:hypothetical protein BG000_007344 [Podila horticola]|nr:hypothetical protein BG000_007344 [Podila horticola]
MQQQNYSYGHAAKIASVHMSVRKPAYTQTQKFKNHFQSGAVSLSLSYAVMHPLDTLKTRMQVPGGRGIAWSAVFTRETLRLLGKGFLVSSIGAGLQGAISAIIGDLASSVIKVPREVVTSRLQTGYYASAAASGHNVNAGFVFRSVLREEGARGLFRGFWSTTARDCPFMVILFTTYENFKAFHISNMQTAITSDPSYVASSPVEVKIPAMTSTLFGGISGFLAGYFTTPMDVIRTRIMTFKKAAGVPKGLVQDISMTGISREMYQQAIQQAAARSVRSNGVVQSMRQGQSIYRAFFVGSIPRSMWWFCVCSIFFSTYEVMKQNLMPLDYEQAKSA